MTLGSMADTMVMMCCHSAQHDPGGGPHVLNLGGVPPTVIDQLTVDLVLVVHNRIGGLLPDLHPSQAPPVAVHLDQSTLVRDAEPSSQQTARLQGFWGQFMQKPQATELHNYYVNSL